MWRNGGATAARRAGGACIAPRATPISTGRTARRKECAPCPCPRRPGCLAGLRVSRPGSAPFASTPPPPLPILGPKMASAGGAWRAVGQAHAPWTRRAGPGRWFRAACAEFGRARARTRAPRPPQAATGASLGGRLLMSSSNRGADRTPDWYKPSLSSELKFRLTPSPSLSRSFEKNDLKKRLA